MTTGNYQRREIEVVCPKCGRTFTQKKVSGGPCMPCQQRQRLINDRLHRQIIDGSGAIQGRGDSIGDCMNLTARYIGKGCFTDGEYIVAFVTKRNRPDHLTEGTSYRLEMRADSVTRKALYYVQGEA